jgi:Bacterial Ig domain
MRFAHTIGRRWFAVLAFLLFFLTFGVKGFAAPVASPLPGAGTSCATNGVARTVVVCQPVNNSTVSSPVHVTAAIHLGSSALQYVGVFVDGKNKYSTGLSGLGNADNGDLILNVDVPMAAGTHRITVQAVDGAGAFKATVYATVQSAGTGCQTNGTARTTVICQPANGSTTSSPVHVTAAVHPETGVAFYAVQVYVDGQKKYETDVSGLGNADNGDLILNVDIGMSTGMHRITVQAVDAMGAYKATVYATVQ